MNYRFAKRAATLKASEIREILKLTEQPEVISFAGGLPAPELFPLAEIAKISEQVLASDGKAALQYSATEGFMPLREIIASQRMAKAGVNLTKDDILITAGSQQGIEFSARLFLDKDDYVICESPSYLGALNAFNIYEPRYLEIPMDEDGMIIEELEKTLAAYPQAKMIYTVPDFQNPTGRTLSLARRQRLAELAAQYQIPVIEDNPYGELIFAGNRYPAIKSFDQAGWVIYLGSFSKTFCPGYRIGWLAANPTFLRKFVMMKQASDLQCSTIAQREVALYLQQYDLDAHIALIRQVYKQRRDLMLECMNKYFPAGVKHTNPQGGLFTWVELKPGLDAAVLLQEALAEKVAFVPGAPFFPHGHHPNFLRLNYSNMPEERIIEGIQRLAKVLARHY
jgi:2-aminoadipate transaminase